VIVTSKISEIILISEIHFQMSKMIIFTCNKWIVDIKNRHFN